MRGAEGEHRPYVYKIHANVEADDRDGEIAAGRYAARCELEGARVGDFILWPDGRLHRFSHDWGDSMPTSPGGSFYLHDSGRADFSGGLDPAIDKLYLEHVGHRFGHFWFFHHDIHQAFSGVGAGLLCRVYQYVGPKKHIPRDWKGSAQELNIDEAMIESTQDE